MLILEHCLLFCLASALRAHRINPANRRCPVVLGWGRALVRMAKAPSVRIKLRASERGALAARFWPASCRRFFAPR
jgi:hypothetical protein